MTAKKTYAEKEKALVEGRLDCIGHNNPYNE